ncbi:regulator of nonsense transcripts 3A-like isoform X4 [Acipenser ruthenus]|uniref:regulator of nonsense transcripts 3A-like isoform X4 n=1 Tax=Acipenser ruthenus TaxID=7906 RepID=UPI00145AD819|nr:regulator of nonsense transcripts 3A-like isoform X4 [Acipenser ruthenus]
MRSEREVMTGGRERKIVEIHFRDQDSNPANIKHKEEKREVFTKVVIRRLPPNLSKEQLEEQLNPLPAYDYFEFFSADQSLYPHLFSRAYINFKNPEDIVLFRDRFDGYVFIDHKDPEYKKFLESYCGDEEKATANPETLLGEIEAKTRELIAKRTTPLLEYIKNKKLEKQRIREEKREERRRRELEKKRMREEEKRKRREEERRKRKETEKQKKLAEKEIKIKLLKKPDKDDEQDLDKLKEKGDCGDIEKGKWDKNMKSKQLDTVTKDQKEKVQTESDKEQREHGRRLREKDHDRPRCREDERKRQRHHYEFDKFMRRKEETKWGKGYCHDRAKKDIHNSYSYCLDGDKLGKEDRGDDIKDRIRNKSVLVHQEKRTSHSEGRDVIGGALPAKDRPAMQLYQPGARSRTRLGSGGKSYDSSSKSPDRIVDRKFEAATGTGSEKSGEE